MSQALPILLFNDECSICRRISKWVGKSAKDRSGQPTIREIPIGESPEALKLLNPKLNIWDAYATIHLMMPDGSMRLGGEAVAEVLRKIPKTSWFSWTFEISIFGFRPFQAILNRCYAILAGIRPIFGCESCGSPVFWMKPLHRLFNWIGGDTARQMPLSTALSSLKIPARP